MLGVGCWVLGVECWVLSVGCWVLGVVFIYSTLNTQHTFFVARTHLASFVCRFGSAARQEFGSIYWHIIQKQFPLVWRENDALISA